MSHLLIETHFIDPVKKTVLSTNGQYYKHMTIVNDNSSIFSEQSFKLIDDTRGVIYDRRMLIIQATNHCNVDHSHSCINQTLGRSNVCLQVTRSSTERWVDQMYFGQVFFDQKPRNIILRLSSVFSIYLSLLSAIIFKFENSFFWKIGIFFAPFSFYRCQG
jgi:hypothetical protein